MCHSLPSFGSVSLFLVFKLLTGFISSAHFWMKHLALGMTAVESEDCSTSGRVTHAVSHQKGHYCPGLSSRLHWAHVMASYSWKVSSVLLLLWV